MFNKYPYTDLHELNADYLLENSAKAQQDIANLEVAFGDLLENLKKNNTVNRDYATDSHLGRAFAALRRKVLSMSGTLKDVSLQMRDMNIRIGSVSADKVEMAVNGASFRLYVNYEDTALNGLITRLRGYGFSTNDLYRPKGSADNTYSCKVYVNGVLAIADSSTALSSVFHKGDTIESLTVVTQVNPEVHRILHVDKAGILIIRDYATTTAAAITGSPWTDSLKTNDVQFTVNTGGGSLTLVNDNRAAFSSTHIMY